MIALHNHELILRQTTIMRWQFKNKRGKCFLPHQDLNHGPLELKVSVSYILTGNLKDLTCTNFWKDLLLKNLHTTCSEKKMSTKMYLMLKKKVLSNAFFVFSQNWGCEMSQRSQGMAPSVWDLSSWNQWEGSRRPGDDVSVRLWKAWTQGKLMYRRF